MCVAHAHRRTCLDATHKTIVEKGVTVRTRSDLKLRRDLEQVWLMYIVEQASTTTTAEKGVAMHKFQSRDFRVIGYG